MNSNYSAEYGRASGGVINTITKSGTNQVHGSFYWFFRNRSLDARDRFAAINPQDVRNQTGGTIGGPIKKDKLFAFFGTEIQRRHEPMVDSIINSSVNGATQTWIGCAAPATAAQCAAANNILPRLFGLTDRRADQQLYFLKLDYHMDDRNTFSASLNYLKFISPNGIQTGVSSTSGAAVGTNGDDSVRDRIGKLSWTFVPTNSMVNEFRFGWFKDRQADDFNPTLLAGYPIGTVSLSVAGLGTLGGYNVLPRVNPSENRYQWADNLSWVKGPHTFKFGMDIARTEDYANSLEQPLRILHLLEHLDLRRGLQLSHGQWSQPLFELRPGLRQPHRRHRHHRPRFLRARHLEGHIQIDRQLRTPATNTRSCPSPASPIRIIRKPARSHPRVRTSRRASAWPIA